MSARLIHRAKRTEKMKRSATPSFLEWAILPGICILIAIVLSYSAGPALAQAGTDSSPNRPDEPSLSFLPLIGKTAQMKTSRDLGQVTVLSTPTDCGGDQCYNLRVACPNVIQTRDVSLRIGFPTGSPFKGTVLFATGWVGDYWWGNGIRPIEALSNGASPAAILENNADIITALKAAGYRTVELKWASNWFQAASGQAEGMAKLACRPATVMRWVYDNVHNGDSATPYCASGHSNGASQVSFALAQYGLSNILSAVVNESGPNWSREDDHCIYNPSSPALFGSGGDRNTDDWAFGYPNNGTGPCALSDPAYKQHFINASLQYGHWQDTFAHTFVAFVFGELDTTATRAQGQAYYDFLAANNTLISAQVVPGANHAVTETLAGKQALEDTIKNVCVLH